MEIAKALTVVTLKAMPTPLTRIAARDFDVRLRMEAQVELAAQDDNQAVASKYLPNANYF